MSRLKDKIKSKNSIPPLNPFQVARWSGATALETEEEAQSRVQALQEAMNTSKQIDQYLLEGKKEIERRRKAIKILLLGQAESGKSSVLKNFQLTFAPNHFESERAVWRVIIQLNIIGTLKTILDALKEELEPDDPHVSNSVQSSSDSLTALRRLRLSLSPLFFIESNLLKLLAPECNDSRDMSVRAGTGWKTVLRSNLYLPGSSENRGDRRRSLPPRNEEHDPSLILIAQRAEIISAWNSVEIQGILHKRRPRLRHSPGFFMDDIERITRIDYSPTDADILRARIRTMGVEEHQFRIEPGHDKKGPQANIEYFITDVGGTRHQRASWAPFFDDVQVILFLAPLAFNQTLDEDGRTNRLADSLLLWKDICENKLLANANLICFFNKRDVLQATLDAGVQVKKYVPTYGDLPNDILSVTKYFKDKFRLYHKKYSPEPRPFLGYETSAIDIKSMSVLLTGVRESILRQELRDGDLI